METTRTSACIGCKMPNGKITYVECRYDGYLSHVGRILVERYNDIAKMVALLKGGDIVSVRDDLESTVRERPLDRNQLEDRDVKEASWIGDYLLNGNGDYKHLFGEG